MRAEVLAGIVVLAAVWAAPVSGQVCLGRTPTDGGSFEVVAVAGPGVPVRLSGGDQVGDGLVWRVGVIAADEDRGGLHIDAVQGEVAFERPLAGRARICPGASLVRTVPGVDAVDELTALDLFVGLGFPIDVDGPAEVVPFVTPHLVFAAAPELVVVNPTSSWSGSESAGDVTVDAIVGATVGVGVFIGRFRIRGMLGLGAMIGDDSAGTPPLLSFGLGWSPH